MRIAIVFLAILSSSTLLLGQEKARVDVDASADKTYPDATPGMRHGVSTPPRPRDLYWRIDLTQQTGESAGTSRLEVHLVNVSALTLLVPLSQDGSKAVKDCSSHPVLELSLSVGKREDYKYRLEIGEFRGCAEVLDTVTFLKPGEWVSFIKSVPTDRLPNEMRAVMRLAQMSYVETARGRTSEEIDSTSAFSPWQLAAKPINLP